MEKSKAYKYCIVPMCENTSRSTPSKLFFYVPKCKLIRDEWCRVIRRPALSDKTVRFCCEDHFNVEDDVENYTEHKIMKVTPRLKSGVLPTKFISKNRPDPTSPPEEHNKRTRIDEMPSTSYRILAEDESIIPSDMAVQVKSNYRSKVLHEKNGTITREEHRTAEIPNQRKCYINKKKDPCKSQQERPEIKFEVEEGDIKEEILQEDLVDTKPELNYGIDMDNKTFNLINEDCKMFATEGNETLDTEENESLPTSEFIKCESAYSADMYDESEINYDPAPSQFHTGQTTLIDNIKYIMKSRFHPIYTSFEPRF